LGLGVGALAMVPRFAAGIEAAAVRFQDQPGYAATVLSGARVLHPVSPYRPAPAGVPPASVIIALCSVLFAVLLALAALYWRRLPVVRALRRTGETGRGLTVAVRRFQSGVINDYITWLVAGVATLGAVLALIVR